MRKMIYPHDDGFYFEDDCNGPIERYEYENRNCDMRNGYMVLCQYESMSTRKLDRIYNFVQGMLRTKKKNISGIS
jgi:hypothetical protein